MTKYLRAFVVACMLMWLAPIAHAQNPNPTTKVLQTATAATGNGSVYTTAGRYEHLDIVVDYSAGGSLSVISIEEADSSAYAGTWSVIQTVTQTAASTQTHVHMDGVFKNIRARITTGVTGGTVTVTLYAYVEKT